MIWIAFIVIGVRRGLPFDPPDAGPQGRSVEPAFFRPKIPANIHFFTPEWRNGRRRGLKRHLLSSSDSLENSILTRVFSSLDECRRASFTSSKATSNLRGTAHQTAQGRRAS